MVRIEELNIGDRFYLDPVTYGTNTGRVATVIVKETHDVGVSFDDWHEGHNLDGSVTDCSGWWLFNGTLVEEATDEYGTIDSEVFENVF